MRRYLLLSDLGVELELGKVVAVDTPKPFIMIEQMPDQKWRLTYQKTLVPDITKLNGIMLVREE